jgi:hypothetical protein
MALNELQIVRERKTRRITYNFINVLYGLRIKRLAFFETKKQSVCLIIGLKLYPAYR